MGLPVLAIRDSMTSQLETILRENGMDVQRESLDERHDPEVFLMTLVCTDGDESVFLRVQRERHVNREGPIIVIQPSSKGILHDLRHSRQSNQFMERVSEILQRNGAWIPVREEAT